MPVALAGLFGALVLGRPANSAEAKIGIPNRPRATIYSINIDSITAYAPGSDGNVFPVLKISDRNNGLVFPSGLAVDSDRQCE